MYIRAKPEVRMYQRTVPFLIVAILFASSSDAQESPTKRYSDPIGVPQTEFVRVQVVPMTARVQVANGICNANVTVDILQANTLQVLASSGSTPVSIGNSLTFDFAPNAGPPPARVEVIVSITVARTPTRPTERDSLPVICPLVGSVQLVDSTTGRTEQAQQQKQQLAATFNLL